MPAPRTQVLVDAADRPALRLGLGAAAPFGDAFVLVEDPRSQPRASLLAMMVLRSFARRLDLAGAADLRRALQETDDWCYDAEGGSRTISQASTYDAYRLALQYGLVDAVMAGSATVLRHGIAGRSGPGHLWQPYAVLAFERLAPWRGVLEPAIAELRRRCTSEGLLSERRYPAQIALTESGLAAAGAPPLWRARIFADRHPDGSAVEAYVVTSEAGAERLRESARRAGRSVEGSLLVAASAADPARIDAAQVAALLRSRLDVRVAEHDGGAVSLESFAEAGALSQLCFTLMDGRSVADVLRAPASAAESGAESPVGARRLRSARRLGPALARLVRDSPVVYAARERGGEAVAVTFDCRARRPPTN